MNTDNFKRHHQILLFFMVRVALLAILITVRRTNVRLIDILRSPFGAERELYL